MPENPTDDPHTFFVESHFQKMARRAGGIPRQVLWGSMGGDDLHVVCNAEFIAGIGRQFHGGPIGVAAHQDAYQRSRTRILLLHFHRIVR